MVDMSQSLTEDDIYRTSTQFRLWSFSPESLATLRQETHAAATKRAQGYLAQNGATNGHRGHEEELLTIEEEARLVQRYCDQIRTTSDHFKWPVNVKATAVQYLKRFYLTNSCHTYPPKDIYKSVLFLASKTEGTHMSLSEYARRIKTEPEQVLAPEYKIIQALRFTLDVRQPFRGLKGALMELLNMANGKAAPMSQAEDTASTIQQRLIALPDPAHQSHTSWTPPPTQTQQHAVERIHAAYGAARHMLDAPALLTDAYFLYTPPQISFAALHAADSVLTKFYLSTKMPADSSEGTRVYRIIQECGDMLAAHSKDQIMSKEERAALEERLERCRDPSTRDLLGAVAKAREDAAQDGKLDETVAERRKAQREASMKEGDDLFGPSLSSQQRSKVENG